MRTARLTLLGLPPIADHRARVLILGSMPGAMSLQRQQYYAHPGNRFWRVAGRLLGFEPSAPYGERTERIKERGLALWDVLARCRRPGSLDASIERGSEVPNDFAAFLGEHPGIETIGLNGSAAAASFRRAVLPSLGGCYRVLDLPSTSGANAAWTWDRLIAQWAELLGGRGSISRPASG